MLARDFHFSKVGIGLARLGENVRSLQVVDTIEPRVYHDGGDFPCILDRTVRVDGDGATDALSGYAIVVVDCCHESCGTTH